MIRTAILVFVIIVLFPNTPARDCLVQRHTQITQALTDIHVAYPAMPIELVAAVGFAETHLGCDIGEGGGWGAPIDARHRHTAGTPMHAARILWRSYEVCGSWEAATRRFRTGVCGPTPIGSRYARMVTRVAQNIHTEALRRQELVEPRRNVMCM